MLARAVSASPCPFLYNRLKGTSTPDNSRHDLNTSASGLVTAIATAFKLLLLPFEWAGIFVPILPSNALEVMEAPVPFIGTAPTCCVCVITLLMHSAPLKHVILMSHSPTSTTHSRYDSHTARLLHLPLRCCAVFGRLPGPLGRKLHESCLPPKYSEPAERETTH